MASSTSFVATNCSIPNGRKRVIGELTRGREIADQLRLMLRVHSSTASPTGIGLVGKVLDSFTRSISILRAAGVDSVDVSQVPVAGESRKRPGAAKKDRRGCYKRRRTAETWIKESSTLYEDGHAWRKYGQKVILNAKHPRNYFRCTHKFDQGCQASKQVQMTRDDPPLYRTTYYGQHSCKNLFNLSYMSHQIILDDQATYDDSSVILSFATSQPDKLGYDDHSVIDVPAAIKPEDRNIKLSPVSNLDYFASSTFDTCSGQLAAAFSSGSVDHGGDGFSSDVYSCTASTDHHHHSLEIDMMVDSVFEDFFEFDSLT
ncbi:hypothetical protein CASFOL_040101 [Castilleja foliolosa]|uniref:WRKY domain-containing protein n=1 Tax=Castilleja foliolosa TaxID=1961234 RepID=A0ABD3BEQ3_9LAMI